MGKNFFASLCCFVFWSTFKRCIDIWVRYGVNVILQKTSLCKVFPHFFPFCHKLLLCFGVVFRPLKYFSSSLNAHSTRAIRDGQSIQIDFCLFVYKNSGRYIYIYIYEYLTRVFVQQPMASPGFANNQGAHICFITFFHDSKSQFYAFIVVLCNI